ncbi:MAG: hypothetical protein Q7S21_04130 [archaeon]|nr:hypothetical protein [archaeon]
MKKHDLPVGEIAYQLALQYLKEYKGNANKSKIFNDFLIVAVASLKNLPIVCTEDNKTMASNPALKAYKIVNKRNSLNVPEFIGFDKFKKLL